MPSTRSSCFWLTIGPSSTSSRYGSPRRRRFAFSASSVDVLARRCCDGRCGARSRSRPGPGTGTTRTRRPTAAASRSASSSTTNALLPPSSRLDPLEQLAGQRPDPPARGGRPGERHDRLTLGSVTIASPTSAPPITTWSRPSGRPGLAEDGLEHRAAADRRLGIGLEDDGVAERQRRRDDAHPEHRSASSTA